MNCKICNSHCNQLFDTTVLHKHQVSYYKCSDCGFIQTEQPYWLKEAYQSAITSLDLGYVTRNLMYKDIVSTVIKKHFPQGRYLDYGGGYGLFVRLMRDLGFDFVRQDEYCENIFAKGFDIVDNQNKAYFQLLTAFEVFEHLENPLREVDKMLKYSDSILFSTTLQPKQQIDAVSQWDYFAPETGQHIAFYTKKALSIIADKYRLNLYSNDKDLHLLTQKKMGSYAIKYIWTKHQVSDKLTGRYFFNKKSLLPIDVEHMKKAMLSNGEK